MTAGTGYGLQAGEGERTEMLGTETVVLAGVDTGASFGATSRVGRLALSRPPAAVTATKYTGVVVFEGEEPG